MSRRFFINSALVTIFFVSVFQLKTTVDNHKGDNVDLNLSVLEAQAQNYWEDTNNIWENYETHVTYVVEGCEIRVEEGFCIPDGSSECYNTYLELWGNC